MKLELYKPAKPYIITQAWGIYNPAYKQFGFERHNGVDFAVDADGIVKAMCEGTVIDVGFNSGAGNYVKYMTDLVECEGEECYVLFMYMHAEKNLCEVGQKVIAGTPLMKAGNTGFSTGPHTHISACRLGKDKVTRLDNDYANRTFDFTKYYNGKFADDISLSGKYQFSSNLSTGSVGAEVYQLQKRLVELGYAKFTPIGIFGEKTRKAVIAYQLENGINPAIGYVGEVTRKYLNS